VYVLLSVMVTSPSDGRKAPDDMPDQYSTAARICYATHTAPGGLAFIETIKDNSCTPSTARIASIPILRL
jgi:hypothetical protein